MSTFSFAQFLLSSLKEYNGHLQHEATGISVEDGLNICKELETLTDNNYSFVLQLWTCGGYTIYQVDYWKRSEHILGDTDRMILSVSP